MQMQTLTAAVLSAALAGVVLAARPAPAGEVPVSEQTPPAAAVPTTAELREMTARFAPADIGADITALPDRERRALGKLVEAARLMDSLFLRQVWSGNDAMLQELSRAAVPRGAGPADARQADAEARLHYFLINKGPWSRLDHNRVFIPGAPAKPAPANFYPAGADKADVERWLDGLDPTARAAATGFFTTIRRAADGSPGAFTAVPYSIEYQAGAGPRRRPAPRGRSR